MKTNEKGETGDEAFMNDWQPFAIEAMKQLEPDMVVSDIWSRVGMIAADEMSLPVVQVNVFPWAFSTGFGIYEIPNFRDAHNCCGCICMLRKFMPAMAISTIDYWMKANPKAAATIKAAGRRVTIVTSFFGYEPGEAVPPNFVFTGPLYEPPTDLMPVLKSKDSELYDWLDAAL